MQPYEWRSFERIDLSGLQSVRHEYHRAIQSVAAVGRKFLPSSTDDANAALIWVSGLSRLAGHWVQADVTFRSSIGFNEFCIYLVDEKVQVLAEFELDGRTHRELMLWLEEQIGKLGLDATNLTLNLPYELPSARDHIGRRFIKPDPQLMLEFSKFFHNSYVLLREIKASDERSSEIRVWPQNFDQAMDILLKKSGEPETDTRLRVGMSPGDTQFHNPYFYVSSWPFIDVSTFDKLSNNAIWVSGDWTGAVLPAKYLNSSGQKQVLKTFYQEATTRLSGDLTD